MGVAANSHSQYRRGPMGAGCGQNQAPRSPKASFILSKPEPTSRYADCPVAVVYLSAAPEGSAISHPHHPTNYRISEWARDQARLRCTVGDLIQMKPVVSSGNESLFESSEMKRKASLEPDEAMEGWMSECAPVAEEAAAPAE